MKHVPRCPWLAAVFCQQSRSWQLGAGALAVVGWHISDLSYWNIAKKDNANRSRTTAFQCAHISYTYGKCIFSYPNVWLDIFRVPLTELRSVTSQICTNRIVCSSVKPSQLDLDRASTKFNVNKPVPRCIMSLKRPFWQVNPNAKSPIANWDFEAMCALKTNTCDRHKVTVSPLPKVFMGHSAG